MAKQKRKSIKHFTDPKALRTIGEHCARFREQKGFSMDRLSKEAALSSSIIHRLENGSGPVSIISLIRYAHSLGMHPKELIDLTVLSPPTPQPIDRLEPFLPKILDPAHPRIRTEAYTSLLPLYSVEATAGTPSKGQLAEEIGWIEIPKSSRTHFDKDRFVVKVVGHSMEPKIPNGSYAVFRKTVQIPGQGAIVLAEYRGPLDPETGGSYTVKQLYSSRIFDSTTASDKHQYRLVPINPAFETLIIETASFKEIRIVGELQCVLGFPF